MPGTGKAGLADQASGYRGYLMGIMTNRNACRGKLTLFLVAVAVLAGAQTGLGENQDIEQLRQAAEQGDASAQRELGARYSHGEGVPQDYQEAVKWYRKAAEQGDIWAQFCLGDMYSEGQGVPRDHNEAGKWYRQAVKQAHKAAERGDASSQFQLGAIYQLGRGVPKHDGEAVKWFRKAAGRGRQQGPASRLRGQRVLQQGRLECHHRHVDLEAPRRRRGLLA